MTESVPFNIVLNVIDLCRESDLNLKHGTPRTALLQ